jgi:hypothetical protein
MAAVGELVCRSAPWMVQPPETWHAGIGCGLGECWSAPSRVAALSGPAPPPT